MSMSYTKPILIMRKVEFNALLTNHILHLNTNILAQKNNNVYSMNLSMNLV